MRIVAFILFNFIFTFSKGEIVKFKFQLLSKVDSSALSLEEVKINPIKSYVVDEIEHHEKPSVKYSFKNSRIYYDKEFSCNIFEYESKAYPFNDIFLTISSDSFYYFRPWESDDDEANCIHLKADRTKDIYKVYLSRYRFVSLYKDKELKNDLCVELSIWMIFGKDTVKTYPPLRKLILNSPDSLIRTFALNNENIYLLMVENYGDKNYSYCYYNFNDSNKFIETINLADLNYIKYPYSGSSKYCVKYSKWGKRNQFTEYYEYY